MMTFCKKSVHSLLGLSIPMNLHSDSDLKFNSSSNSSSAGSGGGGGGGGGGIGLITATGDSNKTSPNVLESATVLTRSSSCPLPPVKRDPCGIGFIDDVGGGVNGLMSCTESLGFESCDERSVDDEIEICSTAPARSNSDSSSSSSPSRVRISKVCGRRREVKKFPPPLSSLNHNGQPSFFLQPVRKDGRLELMEVRIDRPEILRASRQDGRLRLHLIRDDFVEDNQVQEEEAIKENYEELEVEEERIEVEDQEEEESVKEEERNEEWRFPVAGGLMRCHEAVVHHHDYHRHHHHQHNNHHHNLHVWSQYCVTTS